MFFILITICLTLLVAGGILIHMGSMGLGITLLCIGIIKFFLTTYYYYRRGKFKNCDCVPDFVPFSCPEPDDCFVPDLPDCDTPDCNAPDCSCD